MATVSTIEWTEMTWNPVTGCIKISQGCKHCYAERMAKRLKAMGAMRYRGGFRPTLHYDLIDAPRRWKRPRLIFVNSMSDLFQEAVPDDFIRRVFDTMRECPQHTFQILTKRSWRIATVARECLDGRERRRWTRDKTHCRPLSRACTCSLSFMRAAYRPSRSSGA
jgi:protein gp37